MTKAVIYDMVSWLRHGGPTALDEALGIDQDSSKRITSSERYENILAVLSKDDNAILKALLVYLCDNAEQTYYTAYEYELKKGFFPTHAENRALDLIYGLLCDLGYQMSDEELALKEGTSELLRSDEDDGEVDLDEDDDLEDEEAEEDDLEEAEPEDDALVDETDESEYDNELVSSLKEMYGAEDEE